MRSRLDASRTWIRALGAGAGRLAGVACALAGLAGCGAKTGLYAPDVADVVEAGAPDADAAVPPPSICLEPGPDAGVLAVDLTTDPHVSVADVLFVIDRTGSMDQEIDNIRQNLRTLIVPGLTRAIPDLEMGVITFGDFPIEPYGAPEETPFTMVQSMTRDSSAVQGALNTVRAGFGGDNPEAHIEALYQAATGEGFGRYIERASGCPSVGFGYACFRPRAQPIVVLLTDAPMHNGPPVNGQMSNPYQRTLFAPDPVPHSYDQAVAALNAVHARVIGINSGIAPYWGRDDLLDVARDTGSIGTNGQPLVFDIGNDGSGLGPQVVTAIQRFTDEVRFSVSTRVLDIDGSGGASLVRAVRPQRAEPMSQIDRLDDNTFYGVIPGTHLVFSLELDRARAMQTDVEQHFRIRIEFLADGRPTLGFRDVDVVIPARGHSCPVP